MSLIVEDGTGLSTAESFASTAEADTHHSDRGNTLWATLSTAEKEQALRRATDFMEQTYRERWKGYRLNGTQALDWPRTFVYLESFVHGAVGTYPYLVASDIVPAEVKKACIELAFKAASDDLSPDLSQGIKREKIDVIETEYDQYSPQNKRYVAINATLRPYLKITGPSVTLSRT